MNQPTRKQIVGCARSWLGTHFKHQGRTKRSLRQDGGCDCIGLIAGVAKELQLPSELVHPIKQEFIPLYGFDRRHYAREPDGQQLEMVLSKILIRKSASQIQPADVLLFRIQHQPQHVALASDYVHGGLGMVHAYANARQVVEHRFDDAWREKLVGVFQFPFITE